MIRLNWQNLLFMMFAILAIGCGEDEEPIPTCVKNTYPSGVYISNEGPFSDGSGTITFFNPTNNEVQENGFTANNCEVALGSIVQSIYVFENKAYIMVNNSNKIIVADAETLEQLSVVEGFELPRYFLPVGDDKAFVSQWGEGGVNGSVAVLDLNSLNILKTIPCGSGSENMVRVNNEVFVANAGGFGRDSVVTVINIGTETVSNQLVVGDNPQSFSIDNLGRIWVLSKGYSDFYEPSNNTLGKLSIIESTQVNNSFDIPTSSSWLAINNSGDELYFLSSGGIFRYPFTGTAPETSPFITGNFYAMAVDFNTDQIYASDALDFSAKGTIYRYETNGTAINSFTAGIIPGGFWFD